VHLVKQNRVLDKHAFDWFQDRDPSSLHLFYSLVALLFYQSNQLCKFDVSFRRVGKISMHGLKQVFNIRHYFNLGQSLKCQLHLVWHAMLPRHPRSMKSFQLLSNSTSYALEHVCFVNHKVNYLNSYFLASKASWSFKASTMTIVMLLALTLLIIFYNKSNIGIQHHHS